MRTVFVYVAIPVFVGVVGEKAQQGKWLDKINEHMLTEEKEGDGTNRHGGGGLRTVGIKKKNNKLMQGQWNLLGGGAIAENTLPWRSLGRIIIRKPWCVKYSQGRVHKNSAVGRGAGERLWAPVGGGSTSC